ncbi:MAG TPA: SMC-Scp complex subunit ScpB [Polyangia bacterium]|nr:SMC-Scp complex subunit ScpB [Polyangia bacterium]
MSKRKKRARAEHSHNSAQAAAAEETVEESTDELAEEPAELPAHEHAHSDEPAERPAHEHAHSDEPTGFESEGLGPAPISKVGPLASLEEVDAAIESVLGEEALSGEDPPVLAEGQVLPAMDHDDIEIWSDGAVDAPASDEGSGGGAHDRWEEPTRVGDEGQMAELAAQSIHTTGDGIEGDQPPVDSLARLENIIESLLFAADRPLALNDVKRLVNERDGKKVTAALEALHRRHRGTGIVLSSTAGGWQFRTNPDNAVWVTKLVAGRPARLSRAMLETLAIVAYRQPITRPEIDEIRGVDCGPVLKTLLDRSLIRMIGKKEEVGRPILYGTTPDFLRTFSLKDLTELPTLRQFHELGAAEQAKVDAESPGGAEGAGAGAVTAAPPVMPAASPLPEHDPAEEDALLSALDEATAAATRATSTSEPAPAPAPEPASEPAPEPGPDASAGGAPAQSPDDDALAIPPATDTTRPPTSE